MAEETPYRKKRLRRSIRLRGYDYAIPGAYFVTICAYQRFGLLEIIRAFETFSARRINEIRGTPGLFVRQRNFYEHVIRHESELAKIRHYIRLNPAKWATDEKNPFGIG